MEIQTSNFYGAYSCRNGYSFCISIFLIFFRTIIVRMYVLNSSFHTYWYRDNCSLLDLFFRSLFLIFNRLMIHILDSLPGMFLYNSDIVLIHNYVTNFKSMFLFLLNFVYVYQYLYHCICNRFTQVKIYQVFWCQYLYNDSFKIRKAVCHFLVSWTCNGSIENFISAVKSFKVPWFYDVSKSDACCQRLKHEPGYLIETRDMNQGKM